MLHILILTLLKVNEYNTLFVVFYEGNIIKLYTVLFVGFRQLFLWKKI